MSTPPTQAKARRTLLMVLAVFALPLFIAWILTLGWQPTRTVNYGVLLKPPLQLNSYGVMDATGAVLTVDTVARDWFLVVLHSTSCTLPCQDLVQIAERIKISVGRDTHRVSVALLGPDDDASIRQGQSWLLPTDGILVKALRRATDEPKLDPALLIVDHQGIIVLMYPANEKGTGALKDLKRLLRASAR